MTSQVGGIGFLQSAGPVEVLLLLSAASYFSALLMVILSAILTGWIFLIFRSLRSHIHTPSLINDKIRRKKSRQQHQGLVRLKVRRDLSGIGVNATISNILPRVCVIVPARNEEDSIRCCLESVLSQTYPNFEVIAVDDNSTDSTLQIMRELEQRPSNKTKLKVLAITDKPEDWTGKTWASQQGYLHSNDAKILLFMDADGHFDDPDAITLTVSKLLEEKLDALTGVPFLPLRDFWSKIVMPVWNIYSELFGNGVADVNNPKSKVAFVMGSYFMIRKDVFEKIGTYSSVRQEIQEDRSIGRKLKFGGFRIKMFKVNTLMTALWSRDLSTLWDGIRRTVTPVAKRKKGVPTSQALTIFSMIVLPFIIWPFIAIHAGLLAEIIRGGIWMESIILESVKGGGGSQLSGQSVSHFGASDNIETVSISRLPSMAALLLDSIICTIVMVTIVTKGISKYHIAPFYSLFCVAGAVFLVSCFAYSIIPVLLGAASKPIPWRGRPHLISSEDVKGHESASA